MLSLFHYCSNEIALSKTPPPPCVRLFPPGIFSSGGFVDPKAVLGLERVRSNVNVSMLSRPPALHRGIYVVDARDSASAGGSADGYHTCDPLPDAWLEIGRWEGCGTVMRLVRRRDSLCPPAFPPAFPPPFSPPPAPFPPSPVPPPLFLPPPSLSPPPMPLWH